MSLLAFSVGAATDEVSGTAAAAAAGGGSSKSGQPSSMSKLRSAGGISWAAGFCSWAFSAARSASSSFRRSSSFSELNLWNCSEDTMSSSDTDTVGAVAGGPGGAGGSRVNSPQPSSMSKLRSPAGGFWATGCESLAFEDASWASKVCRRVSFSDLREINSCSARAATSWPRWEAISASSSLRRSCSLSELRLFNCSDKATISCDWSSLT
mmetsp:Transcript_52587/g.114844  ORF Transcript_52587/g.114844 Transcript_52587/m.114844 type:complete len:210 (+) Transcript_52587:72-701(+)